MTSGDTAFVVDASVWVSTRLSTDVNYERSRAWVRRVAREGAVLSSPRHALAEVAGAIARRTGRAPHALLGVEALRASEVRWVDIDADLIERAIQLAAELRIGGSDAIYVALARRTSLRLVSLDRTLVERAGAILPD